MRKGIRHEIEARLYKYAACQEENKTWQETIAAELNKLQPQQLQLFELRYKEKKSEREICRKLHIPGNCEFILPLGLLGGSATLCRTLPYWQPIINL
mgnify:CR=1 FL=1